MIVCMHFTAVVHVLPSSKGAVTYMLLFRT